MKSLRTTKVIRHLFLCLASLLMLKEAPVGRAADLILGWTNNILTLTGPSLPGGKLDIWYLEAFCRPGATDRDWSQTTIPHKTELVSIDPARQHLKLRTKVQPSVEVQHEIKLAKDELDFRVTCQNRGTEPADIQWFQPCIRVDRFTGRAQSNYISRCFIFTDRGLTILDQTRRETEARYRGGQVYVPSGIGRDDVNPRPISADRPANGLIGCFSEDGQSLLATAWDHTQELFQGVIVCIHNDPRVGGLRPGERKLLHGKIYLLKNDPAELLRRFHRDFPDAK